MDPQSKIADNIQKLKQEIAPAKLLAVSKYSAIEEIIFAYEAGQRDFGENRVSELVEKALEFEKRGLSEVRWHFIGHLQSNKISKLLEVKNLYAIHSVDRLELLEKLLNKKTNNKIIIFLEVKTSFEKEKQGFFDPEQINQALNLFTQLKNSNFEFGGFMTMAPIRVEDQEAAARASFEALLLLKKNLEKKGKSIELSMGMSEDYHLALEYQTNWVRIGSKIFKF
jgi:pyridoxal phosphate enzyme (YggS family)